MQMWNILYLLLKTAPRLASYSHHFINTHLSDIHISSYMGKWRN